jgi:1,2-diacylglycerol 3-alpha-glucosyltransferase
VPVVALEATGVVDLIQDGINGRLLAPEWGPGRFARAVDEVLSRVRNEPAWPEAVRASVADLSMESSIAKLEAVYASLVNARPRRDATVWERFLNRLEGERQLALAHSRALMQALNTRQYPADGGCD